MVVIPSDHVAEILVGSHALEQVECGFKLVFLAAPEVSFPLLGGCVRLALSSLASRLRRRLDLFFWNHALFRHLRAAAIDDCTSFKVAQMRSVMRVLHRVAALPLFAALVSALDKRLLFRHDPDALRLLEEIRPRLVLAPASALDSYSHMVLRSASRLCIPTAMVVTHWDYFSKKGLLRVEPYRIYVWGEDMQRLACGHNGVDPAMVKVVGAPQFERYLGAVEGRRDSARAKLGLPAAARVLLFAGTSTPYDELVVLKRLDRVLARTSHENTRIIYRRHPRAWDRRHAERVDVGTLASVVVDAAKGATSTAAEHYLDLMAAIDGIVSPFSTMILEGALCGRPSLCVSFSDGVNDWDFSEANNTEHIKVLEGRCWLDVCRQSADLEPMFEAFLAKLDDAELPARVRKEIKRTIHYNSKSYGERLLRQIQQDFGL